MAGTRRAGVNRHICGNDGAKRRLMRRVSRGPPVPGRWKRAALLSPPPVKYGNSNLRLYDHVVSVRNLWLTFFLLLLWILTLLNGVKSTFCGLEWVEMWMKRLVVVANEKTVTDTLLGTPVQLEVVESIQILISVEVPDWIDEKIQIKRRDGEKRTVSIFKSFKNHNNWNVKNKVSWRRPQLFWKLQKIKYVKQLSIPV